MLADIKNGPQNPDRGAAGPTKFVGVLGSSGSDAAAQAEVQKAERGSLEEDPAIAAKLLESAVASNANPADWYKLARLYEDGRGVTKDDSKALDLLLKSAKQEYAPALYRLGEKYRDGTGVPQDDSAAYTWFALAASFGSGDGKAQMLSVSQYLNSEQIARAQANAYKWVREFPKINPEVPLGPLFNETREQ